MASLARLEGHEGAAGGGGEKDAFDATLEGLEDGGMMLRGLMGSLAGVGQFEHARYVAPSVTPAVCICTNAPLFFFFFSDQSGERIRQVHDFRLTRAPGLCVNCSGGRGSR